MFSKRLRGGALYLAVFISLIIAVLLSMLLLHSYYSTRLFNQFYIRQKVHANLQSGFNYAVSNGLDSTALPKMIDLYGEESDSVLLYKRWWGCYQVIAVKSQWKGISESMLCLTGISFPNDTALVLTENNKAVSVAGNTKLKGACFIPKAGIKPAHIEGETFWGDDIIEGQQLPAPTQLPEINKTILNQYETLINNSGNNDSLLSWDQLPGDDTIKNSFLNKTLRIVTAGELVIDGKRFAGNIILQSPKKITVLKDCILYNVMLLAPSIVIEDEFTGTLQALASDSITTGEEVTLHYPSSLLLLNKPIIDTNRKSVLIPAITIGEKCKIKGTIALCMNGGSVLNRMFLKINKDSEIYGLVYSQGYADIQGTVTGAVYAQSLILQTRSGVYEQHLLNAVIDRKSLSDFFVSGILLGNKQANKVVKWLN